MTAKSKILAKNLVKKLAIMLAPFDYINNVVVVNGGGLVHVHRPSSTFVNKFPNMDCTQSWNVLATQ